MARKLSLERDRKIRKSSILQNTIDLSTKKKKREILNIIDMRLDQNSVSQMNKDQFVSSGKFQMQTNWQRRLDSLHKKSKSVLSGYNYNSYNELEEFGYQRRGRKYYNEFKPIDISLDWDSIGANFKELNGPPVKVTSKF